MSTSKGSDSGNGVQPIPEVSRKMVQSLKEIVNCSEAEIYATLKDCNMDPNEAVNRLLSQDTFHEVKSKREKKKEGKDTTEPRSRVANSSSNRVGKSGADRYVARGSSPSYNHSGLVPFHGKSTYEKANGSSAYTSSLPSVPGMSGANRSRGPQSLSDGASTENKGSLLGTAEGMPPGPQPSSGQHSAWVGVPGQVSMADIVKMGRPHNKTATTSNNNAHSSSASISHHNLRFPDDHASRFHESGVSSLQNVPVKNEWPSIEKPAAPKLISIPDHTDTEVHQEAYAVPLDSVHQDYGAEEYQDSEEDRETEDYSGANDVESLSSSGRIPDVESRGVSLFENDLYKNMSSYQPQAHEFEHQVDVGASVISVTRDLQHLSVHKGNGELTSDGDAPSVVIPDHLQVQTADCSHLSFGSFGTMSSVPLRPNLEEPHDEADISSVGHSDTRNSEYYVDDSLRNTSDGSMFYRTGVSIKSHDPSAASHPEELKAENAGVTRENQYPFPSSNSGYSFDEAQHLNATLNQRSSEMQNLASFSNIMQSYPNSLQNTLLTANVHPSREPELQHSQIPLMQSMSAKYGNSSGLMISVSEALKTVQTGVATGPPVPQHLAVHSYSQPTLPLGPFTNMIGYPFMPPQGYTYVPSAFQQTFPGNSTYHPSLASLLPQYKNSVSVGSLPQSGNIPSGYGAFGNASTNFSVNQPSGTSLNYDNVLSSQYKENNHLISLQQNEWLQGLNSRTMSAVPANTYYNYQGQPQQPGGFRQGLQQQQQQPSQNYGAAALGYPNYHHSQTGVSLDQQPQNPRDGSLGGGPQGQQQPKQSQFWQNHY